MDIEFWKQRWNENQIGFHQSDINPYLLKYWKELNVPEHSLVFVPMCGKSHDLMWLASQQYSILGIECSERAVLDFFKEQQLDMQMFKYKGADLYKNGNINLLHGDFFALDTEDLTDVSIVYDRASMVAMPEDMRDKYASLLTEKLPESASIFLVTLEYDQTIMGGPPFSISEDEVYRLYSERFQIKSLQQRDVLSEQPRFEQKGLTSLRENVYILTPL